MIEIAQIGVRSTTKEDCLDGVTCDRWNAVTFGVSDATDIGNGEKW